MTLIPTRDQPPRLAGVGMRAVQPAAVGATGGIGARQILRIIRKRKWLISLTFVICVGVACVATLLWWLYAPIYRAEAYLEVSPPPVHSKHAGQQNQHNAIEANFQRTGAKVKEVVAKAGVDDQEYQATG